MKCKLSGKGIIIDENLLYMIQKQFNKNVKPWGFILSA